MSPPLPYSPVHIAGETVEALMDAALRCPCDRGDVPLCVQCECLLVLVAGVVNWAFEAHWRSRGKMAPRLWTPPQEDTP